MTQETPSPIDAYLAALGAALPGDGAADDLLDEVRDHLYEATAVGESAGAGRETAEREAVRHLGGVAALAPHFRAAAVVCDARRQANRQLLGVLLLVGWGASACHLLPAVLGQFAPATRPLPVTHAAVGMLLGASLLLLGFSRAPWPWRDARRLAWLEMARRLARWLFQLGLPTCAAMLAQPVGLVSGSPHLWLVAGALGGHLVAGALASPSWIRRHLGALIRWR